MGADRIQDECNPRHTLDIERLHQHLAADRGGAPGNRVHIVDADIGRPMGGNAIGDMGLPHLIERPDILPEKLQAGETAAIHREFG
jgi:hypothetical protein